MYSLNVIQNGTWLTGFNNEDKFQLELLLHGLIDSFYEANQSLNLFEIEYIKRLILNGKEEWDKNSKLKREIEKGIIDMVGYEYYHKNSDSYSIEIDILIQNSNLKIGVLPSTLEGKSIFIYAKAFLYSLDNFEKIFQKIIKFPNISNVEGLKKIHQEFKENFPNLIDIRNSSHHLEDRLQGRNKFNEKIELKPVVNEFINAENGGVLLIGNLNNRKYGNTLSNGEYGEIEVSIDSLQNIQKILQEILNSFNWTGSKTLYPR